MSVLPAAAQPAAFEDRLRHRYRILDQRLGPAELPRTAAGAGWRRPWDALAERGGALVDRLALQAMERMFVSTATPELRGELRRRIEEGLALYARPELFAEPDRFYRCPPHPPAVDVKRLGRLRRGERLQVTFPSTYAVHDASYREAYRAHRHNDLNRVHLWQHQGGRHPTVICIHGWCGGLLPMEERLFDAASFYRLGFNVALFTLPFHGARTPPEARFSGQLFPSRHLRRTTEAFGQAVSDLRALLRWLREEGRTGPVGLLGVSLGGYTAALCASLDPSLAFAIPVVAPCSFADVLWHHGRGRPGRREAESAGFTLADFRALWSIHCPLMHDLRLPRERVMLVWGHGDRIVPGVHQLALREHWGRPAVHSFQGGHLLQLGRAGYLRAIHRWLASLALA